MVGTIEYLCLQLRARICHDIMDPQVFFSLLPKQTHTASLESSTCTNSTSALTSLSTHAHASYASNININDDVLVLSIHENRGMVDCLVVALEQTWSRSHAICQDQSRVLLGSTNSSPPTC
jgi:hypothetical protein